MADYRRVPMTRLISRLGLSEYHNVGPLTEHKFSPKRVVLPLKQHAGAPAIAVVKTGQQVSVGDLIAAPEEGKLGARIHASIRGVVRLTPNSVVIDA
jgi:Na+-translocating ferredoxin:NAD+ oxidoreductase RnfC subunit